MSGFLRLGEFLGVGTDDEDGDIDIVPDAIDGFAINEVGHFVVAVRAEDEEVEAVFFNAADNLIDGPAESQIGINLKISFLNFEREALEVNLVACAVEGLAFAAVNGYAGAFDDVNKRQAGVIGFSEHKGGGYDFGVALGMLQRDTDVPDYHWFDVGRDLIDTINVHTGPDGAFVEQRPQGDVDKRAEDNKDKWSKDQQQPGQGA